MKKNICSLFVLCFSFLFLAGCNSTQTPQSPIQLQVTTAIEPEYDNITVLGKFIIAEKDNQSAIYSYNGTTYQLIAPLGKYTVEKSFANYTVDNILSVYTEEDDPTNYYDNGKMTYNGLIDLNGNLVVPLHDKIFEQGIFESYDYYGDNLMKLYNPHNQTIAFYDNRGNLLTKIPGSPKDTIIPLQIDGQIITLRSPSIQSQQATANLFDKNGNKLLQTDYKYLHPFQNYFIAKSQDNYFGIIDWKGNVIVPFEYANLTALDDRDVNNPWLIVRNKSSDATYLMNLQGEKKLENSGYSYFNILPDGNIKVTKNGKSGIVTLDNQILMDLKNYQDICVYKNQDILYIYSIQSDLDGTKTLTIYDNNYKVTKTINQMKEYSLNYENGQFVIQDKLGNVGVIDKYGTQIIPFEYQQINAINKSYYLATKDNISFFLSSSTGETILSGYESILFNQELVQITKDKKIYYYDYNGNQVNLEYDSSKISNFLLLNNSKTNVNADVKQYNANSLRKNDAYIDNQDGTKNMIVMIESPSGQKGISLIPSLK